MSVLEVQCGKLGLTCVAGVEKTGRDKDFLEIRARSAIVEIWEGKTFPQLPPSPLYADHYTGNPSSQEKLAGTFLFMK